MTVDPPYHLIRNGEAKESHPEPGLLRRIGSGNSKISLAEHVMEQGWVGVAHSHPHDQMAYVVAGRLRVRVGEEEFEVGPGDSFVVRGGMEHQATALEPAHVIDIFTPYRDY
jgi:quercetin dioxygenase-like cupin family protein